MRRGGGLCFVRQPLTESLLLAKASQAQGRAFSLLSTVLRWDRSLRCRLRSTASPDKAGDKVEGLFHDEDRWYAANLQALLRGVGGTCITYVHELRLALSVSMILAPTLSFGTKMAANSATAFQFRRRSWKLINVREQSVLAQLV